MTFKLLTTASGVKMGKTEKEPSGWMQKRHHHMNYTST